MWGFFRIILSCLTHAPKSIQWFTFKIVSVFVCFTTLPALLSPHTVCDVRKGIALHSHEAVDKAIKQNDTKRGKFLHWPIRNCQTINSISRSLSLFLSLSLSQSLSLSLTPMHMYDNIEQTTNTHTHTHTHTGCTTCKTNNSSGLLLLRIPDTHWGYEKRVTAPTTKYSQG